MTLGVAVATAGERLPLSAARVRALARAVLRAERVRHALVSIAFVTPQAIARLNRAHRGHSGATDVIAFTLGRAGRDAPLIGDVYIAPRVARRNARRYRTTVRGEVVRLVVHGLLHVVGRDHPDGDARTQSPMWRRQEELVRRLDRRPT